MFRSEAMRRLARLLRVAALCDRRGISAGDALELAREAEERAWSRREFLRASAGAAAAVGFGLSGQTVARPVRGSPRIAIVGAGLAGLVCADTLRRYGLSATVYEAHATRVGGRCFSLRGLVTGKVAENGGEFIDTTHKTMRAYANEFNLAREDVGRAPGEVAYFFDQRYTNEEVVEEYRQLVERMRPDLQASSGEPTFFAHNEADVVLDQTSLDEYLATRADRLPVVRAAISAAYVTEYGLEPAQQSCLNMLLFLHLDKRRRFTPFGVFSDERFHLVGGNDAIATNIAARLPETGPDGHEIDAVGDEQRRRVRAAVRGRGYASRRCGGDDAAVHLAALAGNAGAKPRAISGQAASDPHARVWEQRQDDDRVPRQAVADREREQRVSVHEPGQRANDVGDQPDDARRGVDPNGLRGRRARQDAGARLGAGAGGEVCCGFGARLSRSGRRGGEEWRSVRRAPRALAQQPADAGFLYVLPAGPVHERCRFGRAGSWQAKVRGRAHGLFLLVARIHGRGVPVGDTRRRGDRGRYPRRRAAVAGPRSRELGMARPRFAG